MSCKILIYADQVEPVEFELNPGVYKIGSSPQASLSLNFTGVFEEHADLEVHENGAVWLVNTSGDPELKVNEAPVREQEMKEKDIISIGDGYVQITSIPQAEIVNSAGPFTGEPVLKLQKKSDSKKQEKFKNWWETFGPALAFPYESGNLIRFLIAGLIVSLTMNVGVVGQLVEAGLLYLMVLTMRESAYGMPTGSRLAVFDLSGLDYKEALKNWFKFTVMIWILIAEAFVLTIGLGLMFSVSENLAEVMYGIILCSLIPIPMLAFSLTERFGTFNPVFIGQSFFRIPLQVFVVGFVLFVLFNASIFCDALIEELSQSGFFVVVLVGTIIKTVSYYLLNSWCCILGTMYFFYKDKLRWV